MAAADRRRAAPRRIWTLAILLFVGLGRAGPRAWTGALERYSARLGAQALALGRGRAPRAARCGRTSGACGRTSLVFGVLTAACAAGWASGSAPLLERLPLALLRGLAWAFPAMASVAAAIAARGCHARQRARCARAAGRPAVVTLRSRWSLGLEGAT